MLRGFFLPFFELALITLSKQLEASNLMEIDKSEYIEMGGCSKPHGIKGAFSFHLYNTEDSVLRKGSKIYLMPKDGSSISKNGEEFEISTIAFGNKVIATLKNVDNRNIVEEMLPFSIFYKKSNLPKTDENEFYLEQLVGLEAIDFVTGEKVGRITDYYDNTAQLILVIKGKENFEIPMIDNFVKEIMIEEGKINIVVPKYLGNDE